MGGAEQKTIFFEEYDMRVEVFHEGVRDLWHCDMLVGRSQAYQGGGGASTVRYTPRHGEIPYIVMYFTFNDNGVASELLPTAVKKDGGGYEHAVFSSVIGGESGGRRLQVRVNKNVAPPLERSDLPAGNVAFLRRAYPPKGGAGLSGGSVLLLSADFPAWFPLYPAKYGGMETYAVAFYHQKTEEARGSANTLDEDSTRELQASFQYYKLPYRRQKLKLVVIEPKAGLVYGLAWRRPAAYELEHANPHVGEI